MSRKHASRDSLVDFHTGMYQDWNLIQQDTAAPAKIEEEQRAEREAKERLGAVWKSTGASGARQFFTKSILGDDAALLARSSGEEPAPPRHRAGVASMA